MPLDTEVEKIDEWISNWLVPTTDFGACCEDLSELWVNVDVHVLLGFDGLIALFYSIPHPL